MDDPLTYWASVSAIGAFIVTLIGSGVGIYGYVDYRCKWSRKRAKLESYLRDAKRRASGDKKGQQTANHLIRHLGLTEDEILKISFESKHVDRRVGADGRGNADVLYFEYIN